MYLLRTWRVFISTGALVRHKESNIMCSAEKETLQCVNSESTAAQKNIYGSQSD